MVVNRGYTHRNGYDEPYHDASGYGVRGLLVVVVRKDVGVLEGAVCCIGVRLTVYKRGSSGEGRTADKGELDASEHGVEVEMRQVELRLETLGVDFDGLWLMRGHFAG